MSKIIKSGLGKTNYRILLIGIILVSLGYIIMATGDRYISPIVLIIAYIVVIPVALLWRSKE
jgi:hypothetical protein